MTQHNIASQKSSRKTQVKNKGMVTKPKRASTVFELIKRDHREIQILFKKIQSLKTTHSPELHETFNTLKTLLHEHDKAEESVLYNKILGATESKEDKKAHQHILKSFEENRIAGMLLNEMSQVGVEDERFMAKMGVLSNTILHHIKEEELLTFAQAKKVLTKEVKADLGKKFIEAKKRFSVH